MTPVILLSDNQVANGTEPWRLPNVDDLPDLRVTFATKPNGPEGKFLPYMRNIDTFARPWAIPGTPGLEHRLGGLEKDSITGNVSYDPNNHQLMTDTRSWKIDNIANDIPLVEIDGPEDADILVLGWGSTHGPITAAARNLRKRGEKVATAHLRHLHPFPSNLGEVLDRFDKVLVPEMNSGQLRFLLRAEFLSNAVGLDKVAGEPFKVSEIEEKIMEMISE
jgi:2-oxoglutarate ferredoxin oxidoreductase subunit alpha